MKEYRLIRNSMAGQFQKLVNLSLEEGWQLQGGPFQGDGDYVQALIREKSANGEVQLREPERLQKVKRG